LVGYEAGSTQFCGSFLHCILSSTGDDHAGTAGYQFFGSGIADPAVAPGNEGKLAL
jgi:hypothetical protein